MNGKKKLKIIDNSKNNLIRHQFIIKELKTSSSQRSLINSEIHKYFNFPEKYFDSDSKIIINKKIDIIKILPLKELEEDRNKTIKKSFSSSRMHNINKLSLRERYNRSLSKNYALIDKEKLRNIFKSFKKISKKTKSNKFTKKTEKKFPKSITENLDMQNHHLLSKRDFEEKNQMISKFLSKKTHKNENILLLNNIHLHYYKKEILEKKLSEDNDVATNNQIYQFKWISTLRKPKKFFGQSKSYLKLGGENNPLWSIGLESQPKSEEYNVNSGYEFISKGFQDFTRRIKDTKYFRKIKKYKNLNKLKIEGKNLLDLEYKREMNGNERKRLYNVFFENGKAIMKNDINNIFGNETIYKKYLGINNNIKMKSFSEEK